MARIEWDRMAEKESRSAEDVAAKIGAALRANPEIDGAQLQQNPDELAETPDVAPEPDVVEVAEDAAPLDSPEVGDEPTEAQEAPADQPDASEDAVETLELDADQLADFLGVPLEVTDDGSGLRIQTKIDGQEGSATLEELRRSYQTDATLTKRGLAVAEAERRASAKLEEREAQLRQDHQQLAALLQQAKDGLNPYAQIDFAALRRDDPTEYSALMAEKADWEGRVNGVAGQAQAMWDQQSQSLGADREASLRDSHTREFERLKSYIPEWSDNMQEELVTYVSGTYSIPPEEVVVNQAWIIDQVRKAKLFDEGSKSVTSKKLKKVPKYIKPKARQSRAAADSQNWSAAAKTHKSEGTVDSFAALMRQRNQRKR